MLNKLEQTQLSVNVASAAVATIVGLFALTYGLVIGLYLVPRMGTGGETTNVNVSPGIIVPCVMSANISNTTMNGLANGPNFIALALINNGNIASFKSLDTNGIYQDTSQCSFLTLDGGIVSLSKVGYYTGSLSITIQASPLGGTPPSTNVPAQNCVVSLIPPPYFIPLPEGWNGPIPFIHGALMAIAGEPPNNLNPTSITQVAPYAFFYNGTGPLTFNMTLTCRTWGPEPVVPGFGSVGITININRNELITGI